MLICRLHLFKCIFSKQSPRNTTSVNLDKMIGLIWIRLISAGDKSGYKKEKR